MPFYQLWPTLALIWSRLASIAHSMEIFGRTRSACESYSNYAPGSTCPIILEHFRGVSPEADCVGRRVCFRVYLSYSVAASGALPGAMSHNNSGV